MKDQSKTKQVLIKELASLKQKTADLERTESGHKRTESQWQVSLTDLAQDAVLMIDPTGCISLWNQAAERIFAYTSNEAIGQDLHQLLAPKSYRKAYRAAFSKFKKTGQGAVLDKTVERNSPSNCLLLLFTVRMVGMHWGSYATSPSANRWMRHCGSRKKGTGCFSRGALMAYSLPILERGGL